ncbi:hypothetical protein GLOIN_2v1613602 [Rhizophagus clarus]|uniref:F-box domain-containing protein n=1 Tax=Rhizophagus clarus TaxID=94130 RepID=A0A8H3QXS3_9GLOM|nr:hypothetical protein GLOIN_2v1613602 [Rhizophagus clarus]
MEFDIKSSIPFECYDEIFYQLRNDRKTLHTCMFVNRYFCSLAITLLWGTPFERINLESQKTHLIISVYVNSLVDEDKSYLRLAGIPVESSEAPYFNYPEFLSSFNSQGFQLLIERWLMLIDPNYHVNYQSKIIYASYIISNLLFASTKKLESLKYFSHNGIHFISHKEFAYSISHLVNLEITYFAEGNESKLLQSDEDKLNNLFNTLSRYTFTIKFVKINISSNDSSFYTRIIKSISNFIAHQFNLEELSVNETLISVNLLEFENIIRSQEINLKSLTIEGKLKNFAKIIKVLRNCTNLESLIFDGKEDRIIVEDSIMIDVDDRECSDIKMRKEPIIEEFEFNQLKIGNIYCIEDDGQQQQDLETTTGIDSLVE